MQVKNGSPNLHQELPHLGPEGTDCGSLDDALWQLAPVCYRSWDEAIFVCVCRCADSGETVGMVLSGRYWSLYVLWDSGCCLSVYDLKQEYEPGCFPSCLECWPNKVLEDGSHSSWFPLIVGCYKTGGSSLYHFYAVNLMLSVRIPDAYSRCGLTKVA